MLEKEAGNIDAVMVGTPDHTHAPAAAMALRLGKHVYCEKPLTHTVYEARTLANLAKEKKLVTQMGTQIHAGDNYRRVVELIKAGAIGKVTEVHVWVAANYSGGKFTTGTPRARRSRLESLARPRAGAAVQRRRTSVSSGGSSGTMAPGRSAISAAIIWTSSTGRSTCAHRRRSPPKGRRSIRSARPAWCIAHYEYPARGDQPPVKLTWYDSGKQPELAQTLKIDGKPLGEVYKGAQLFIGSEGMLVSELHASTACCRKTNSPASSRPSKRLPSRSAITTNGSRPSKAAARRCATSIIPAR